MLERGNRKKFCISVIRTGLRRGPVQKYVQMEYYIKQMYTCEILLYSTVHASAGKYLFVALLALVFQSFIAHRILFTVFQNNSFISAGVLEYKNTSS
jgi:hypothetical protein